MNLLEKRIERVGTMRRLRVVAGLAASLAMVMIVLAACAAPAGPGATANEDASHAGHGTTTGATDAVDHATMDHTEIYDPELPFDAQFIDGMIEHHEGAVEMAHEVLAHSERAELRALAQEIIDAQAEEIEMMNAWRAEWYAGLPDTGGMHVHMGDMEITDASDRPFDQRFLEAMISHHEGAIEMAEHAGHVSERDEVRAFAQEVIRVQQAEIEQMRAWLAEWFDAE